MTTTRPHGDTEARASGFDATLQAGYDWIQAHLQQVAAIFGGLLLLGLFAVGVYEWRKSAEAEAQTALMQIEVDYALAMGSSAGAVVIPEPANEEVAQRSRETALAELEALIAAHEGSAAALIARLRAAEFEVDLGQLEKADARLAALSDDLAADDPRRALALRLRAYTFEARGDYLKAGELYSQGAAIESFPPRVLLFLNAAENFERAGAHDRAITSYEQVLASSPEIAEGEGVLARMRLLEARVASGAAAPAPAAASGTAAEAPGS